MPPAPMDSAISYGPKRVPGVRAMLSLPYSCAAPVGHDVRALPRPQDVAGPAATAAVGACESPWKSTFSALLVP